VRAWRGSRRKDEQRGGRKRSERGGPEGGHRTGMIVTRPKEDSWSSIIALLAGAAGLGGPSAEMSSGRLMPSHSFPLREADRNPLGGPSTVIKGPRDYAD
jgi:hypothetical protein